MINKNNTVTFQRVIDRAKNKREEKRIEKEKKLEINKRNKELERSNNQDNEKI
jgi:hypothetical protein